MAEPPVFIGNIFQTWLEAIELDPIKTADIDESVIEKSPREEGTGLFLFPEEGNTRFPENLYDPAGLGEFFHSSAGLLQAEVTLYFKL